MSSNIIITRKCQYCNNVFKQRHFTLVIAPRHVIAEITKNIINNHLLKFITACQTNQVLKNTERRQNDGKMDDQSTDKLSLKINEMLDSLIPVLRKV